jgi:hypothetical protein
MKWKRTDSNKKKEVIEAKLNNPDLSSRDIEQKLWVPHETTAKILRDDLAQVCTQSTTIAKLIDDNDNIMNLTGDLVMAKLVNWESVKLDELLKARDLAFKQNTLARMSDESKKNMTITLEM